MINKEKLATKTMAIPSETSHCLELWKLLWKFSFLCTAIAKSCVNRCFFMFGIVEENRDNSSSSSFCACKPGIAYQFGTDFRKCMISLFHSGIHPNY